MATASVGPPGGDPRLSTGNTGLDAMLDGGLVPRRPYLIVGPSGTGKTTMALQFLCAGVRKGERTLLVTLEEPPNEVRANHRGLAPELSKVDVFDAIPDVMRYERAPFKDIAAVRSALPFERVGEEIRRTPELTSIEVTITALEQMLRTEVQRHAYTRVVIDSLTALQYFCMKGFDVVAGAQTFLRFLSDLRVTTVLTVEAPLEDIETPERMLARGEIRLFRWELDDVTVRAVGVEKFRGSAHDIRLHPYRIGPKGVDINLAVTISRDTRQVLEVVLAPTPVIPSGESIPSTLDVLAEELRDLVIVGADTGAIRVELEASLIAARQGDSAHATERLTRAVALGSTIPEYMHAVSTTPEGDVAHALRRLAARAESGRAGFPPVRVPEPPILTARLAKILADLRPAGEPFPPPPRVPAPTGPPTSPPPVTPIRVAPPVPAETAHPLPATSGISAPPSTPEPSTEGAGPPPTRPAARVSRTAPPPLPQLVELPPPHLIAPTATSPATSSAASTHLSARAHTPTSGASPRIRVPARVTEVSPKSDETPVAAPPETTVAPTAPKKRKRAPSGSRKKSATLTKPALTSTGPTPAPAPPVLTPEPAATQPPPPPSAAPPVVVAPPPAPVVDTEPLAAPVPGGPEVTPLPRPKRRVVRKKKAPPVVGATPGPPLDEPSPAPPVAAPVPPPTDQPPEAP